VLPAKVYSLIFICVFATGCSNNEAEDLLTNYAWRVGNALEQNVELNLTANTQLIPLFPKKRDRIHPLEEFREGLLDVLELKYCDGLLPLIAERNSSMGKVMTETSQLNYELQFYDKLKHCIRKLEQSGESKSELREILTPLHQLKSRNLPKVVWNGIYGSDEVTDNFSTRDAPLVPGPQNGFSSTLRVFEHFVQISHQASQPRDWRMPSHQQTLSKDYQLLFRNRAGSRWLKSVQMLTDTLNQTADAIHKRLALRPFCYNRTPSSQAKILQNVFVKYYAGELQPYLSTISRQGERWLDLNRQLLQVLPATDSMHTYLSKLDSESADRGLWQNFIAARDRHTQAWQKILGQCGLMPSREN